MRANIFAATLATLACVTLLAGCGTPYATQPIRQGEPVMLLGYDPVAYFTLGKPTRGKPEIKHALPERTYYFASQSHLDQFKAEPARFEPQYGGFCASGAAFDLKLGSDPGAWEIRDGRLFIFGDIIGHEMWKLDPAWNIAHADRLWPEMAASGWRWQTIKRLAVRVEHYQSFDYLMREWERRHPGQRLTFDPGSMWANLVSKRPGWRAAEGFGQAALGYPD